MKIRVCSDLHLEHHSINFTTIGEDLIVLAGDIAPHTQGVQVAKQMAQNYNLPVIVIAGNHEYYQISGLLKSSHTWEGTLRDCIAEADHTDIIAKGDVTFFENGSAVYQGVRFIGATLWTDMNYFGQNYLVHLAVTAIGDYHHIWSEATKDLLSVEQVITRHQESLAYFREKLSEPFEGPTVVISHHMPSSLSVSEQYRDDLATAGFASRLEDFILEYEPTVFIHGHTHDPYDYMLGKTRIVCNPRGYPSEDTGWNPELIIEV